MFRLLLLSLMAATVWAQTQVSVSDGPPVVAYQKVYVVNGSNLTTAICFATSVITTGPRALTGVAISAISKAAAAVVTSVGHGFAISGRPSVTISGATGTGWITGINGTFTATVIDADTFSVAVASTGFGTLAGTVVFKTTAPRSTMYEWAVQKYVYDGSNNVIWSGWLNGSTGLQARCSDASVATVQQQ